MQTIHEFLKESKKYHEKLKDLNFPFNDREVAKAELVMSLLKKVDSGELK